MGGTFGHLYYRDGYLINRASSGGSPGPIWLTVWQLDGSEINTIKELEFDKNIDKHGEPLVTGAESYADAENMECQLTIKLWILMVRVIARLKLIPLH